MTARAWVNGRLVGAEDGVLRANDHGITVGDGVFETAKVANGQAFALTRHLRRLGRSATGLGLPEPDLDLVRQGVQELLAADEPLEFGRLRITLTAGPGPLGSERTPDAGTLVLQAIGQAPPPPTSAAVIAPWVRNERSPVAGLKTTSYAENVVALAYAKERGASEAILGNTIGDLCEGTGSNVFVAIDGELVTPPLTSGPLAGISRELLIEWAAEAGLTIRQERVPLSVLDEADEIVLTSSIREVQPLHRIADRELRSEGELGELGRRAVEVFAAGVAQGIDP